MEILYIYIYIELMERHNKLMRTSLTKWLKHSLKHQSKMTQSRSLQDGDGYLMALMSANCWTLTIFPDFQILSKKLSRLFKCPDCGRTISSQSIQIQFIQAPSHQHLYEENMPVFKGATAADLTMGVQCKDFLNSRNSFHCKGS